MRHAGTFVIRPFDRSNDFSAFVRLRREIEEVDRTGNDTSETAALATLDWPGHDPGRDRWVASVHGEPESLAGYSWTWSQSPERSVVYATVHPKLRRGGIGGGLLGAALARAAESGSTHATSAVSAENAVAASFLARRGFERAGDNRFMRLPDSAAIAAPAWPAGYHVADFAGIRDLHVLVEAFNLCYGDMWGHRENAAGAMNEGYLAGEMAAHPDLFDPEGIFIAFGPDRSIAGVVVAMMRATGADTGAELVVDSPGAAPGHRHLGLQRQLTLTAAGWLRDRGTGPISLETFGDSEEAFGIYRDLGFELVAHYVEYRRSLADLSRV